MKINEVVLAKAKIVESDRKKLPEGVLCRVTYPVCNIGKRNRNGRVYGESVWERVNTNPDIQEKIKNRTLFGHAEHPETTQSNLEKTSHVIIAQEMKDLGEGLTQYQTFDVLDTPYGRIVDTLLRAGCQVGCSTRAEGELREAEKLKLKDDLEDYIKHNW